MKHNGPFAWTATGVPGFVDFWLQPSEFSGTLLGCAEYLTNGRLPQEDIPRFRGLELIQRALDPAPPFHSLADFPKPGHLRQQNNSKEDVKLAKEFYDKRRVIVNKKNEELREAYRTALEHE